MSHHEALETELAEQQMLKAAVFKRYVTQKQKQEAAAKGRPIEDSDSKYSFN